jgi:GT2 family glycosyltransferase
VIQNSQGPVLSVVLVAYSGTTDIFRIIESLSSMKRAADIELILVTQSRERLSIDLSVGASLSGVQILELPDMKSIGQAKAAGVRAAQSPLVAFTEDHSFPEPCWAEALIEAHENDMFSVVGPVMINADINRVVNWAGFLVFYSTWMRRRPHEEQIDHLPGNHSCYRKEILLAYGSLLEEALESESILHWELVARGYKLRLESKAIVRHRSPRRIGSLMLENYLGSRIFAHMRTKYDTALQRLVYTLGSPAIPLIRIRRIFFDIKCSGLDINIMRMALAPMFFCLCAGAVGEMLGYALGSGKTRERLIRFEMDRARKSLV